MSSSRKRPNDTLQGGCIGDEQLLSEVARQRARNLPGVCGQVARGLVAGSGAMSVVASEPLHEGSTTSVLTEMQQMCQDLVQRMEEQHTVVRVQQEQQRHLLDELISSRLQQDRLLLALAAQGKNMEELLHKLIDVRRSDTFAGATVESLPDSVLTLIFTRLRLFDDVASCACVCRRWRDQLKEVTRVLRTLAPHIRGQDPRAVCLTYDHMPECEVQPRLFLRRFAQLHSVSFSHALVTHLRVRTPNHPAVLSPSLVPSPPDCLMSLRDVSLWCSNLTPECTRFLLCFPALRRLALRADCCPGENSPGLAEAMAGLSSLEELQLVDEVFEEMQEEGVMAVMDGVARLPRLKRLDLSDASGHLPAAALGRNLPSLTCLQDLDLSFVAATDWPPLEEALSFVARLSTLQRLNLSHNDLAIDDLLASLSSLPRLQHLATNCNSPAGIAHIAKVSSLTSLALFCDHSFAMGEGSFAPLARLPHLRKLSFPGVGSRVEDILKEVVPLTQIQSLELERAELGHAAKLYIGQMTHLEELSLHLSNSLNQPLRHFTDLTRLATLNLACTRIRDSDLNDIKWLTGLRVVDVRSCMRLTDRCLQPLRALPLLTCLKLSRRQDFVPEAMKVLGDVVQLSDSSSCFKWNDFECSDLEEDDMDDADDDE